MKYKLAVLVSHPIHYQVGLYRMLAVHPEIDLTVYYWSDFAISPKADPEMGRSFNYGSSILEGYKSRFIRNFSPRPSLNCFSGLFNPGLIGELYKGKYDAVWVHGWATASSWLCCIACKILGIPIMIRGEATLLYPPPPLKNAVKKIVLSTLFKFVDAFLCIGKLNADFYRSYGVWEDRLFPVPYAIDNEYFGGRWKTFSSKRQAMKESLGIPGENTVVLFVGKVVERKGPFDIIRALEKTDIKNASVVFVGEGGQKAFLEAYVKEKGIKNVHFMGFRSQEELPEFLSIADIFVLPSVHEPWGMVVNEAMNFALPIVATDKVGSARDIVLDGENGFIIRAGDVEKLSECLGSLLKDPERRKAMGRRSLEIIGKWSYREDVEGMLDALRHIAGR